MLGVSRYATGVGSTSTLGYGVWLGSVWVDRKFGSGCVFEMAVAAGERELISRHRGSSRYELGVAIFGCMASMDRDHCDMVVDVGHRYRYAALGSGQHWYLLLGFGL